MIKTLKIFTSKIRPPPLYDPFFSDIGGSYTRGSTVYVPCLDWGITLSFSNDCTYVISRSVYNKTMISPRVNPLYSQPWTIVVHFHWVHAGSSLQLKRCKCCRNSMGYRPVGEVFCSQLTIFSQTKRIQSTRPFYTS